MILVTVLEDMALRHLQELSGHTQPDTCSMFAMSFALMGARDLSFLSWRAYGKLGITAVIRLAEAVRQA